MPPASVDEEVLPDEPKLDASDEPKLEAFGNASDEPKLLAMMPLRRTPSLLPSLLRTMMVLITGGMELTGAGTVLLGRSPLGMLQVTMLRGLRPKAIHSQHLLQMTRRRHLLRVQSRRLSLLLQMIPPALRVLGFSSQKAVVLLLLMLLRRLQMTASGACRKCPLLQMMTLPPLRRTLQVLLKSRFWWKPP